MLPDERWIDLYEAWNKLEKVKERQTKLALIEDCEEL